VGTPQAKADKTSSPKPSQKDGSAKIFAPEIRAGLSFSSIKSVKIILFVKFNFLIGKPHLSGFNFALKKEALEKSYTKKEAFRNLR